MHFLITLLLFIPLFINRSCNGSDLDLKKRNTCMSFKEQMTLLKWQYKILEKQMKLKEKDYKIIEGKSKAERMDKIETSLKTLAQNVKKDITILSQDVKNITRDLQSNTKNIGSSRQTINELSGDMKGINQKVEKIAGNLRINMKRLQVLNQDKCQSGHFGSGRYPKPPTWPKVKHIKFNPPFSSKPSVTHGIVGLDTWKDRNLRATVSILNISRFGFTLRLGTNADTVIYGFYVRWMACR